jgi:hypothetical protein
LSADFIKRFEEEIESAKVMDSTQLRSLPPMKMLRILSLKNALSGVVKERDTKTVIMSWLDSAGKGFPLQHADRFYYTPKKSLENNILKDGATYPLVLIIREGDLLKVDPFNTPEYQQARLNNILTKKSLDELIQESAWLHFQTYRPVHWGPL